MQKIYFSLLTVLLCAITLHAQTTLTFTLDLRPSDCEATPPVPGTVSVIGTINSNVPGGTIATGPFAMSDPDGDNVWTFTFTHPNAGNPGTLYAQYRYSVGGTDENLSSVDNSGCSSMATPLGREKFVGVNQAGATGNEYWETCSNASGSCTVLPVEMTAFKAQNDAKGAVALQWQTATELDNAGFAVEHATDGRNFTKLDFIDGNGTTYEVQDYVFSHAAPVAGKNYYRLRQIDFDGAFSLSEVLTVEVRKENILSVQPTLVRDFMQVNYQNDAPTKVTVFDQTGKIVTVQTIAAGVHTAQIDVRNLPQGLYFLTADAGKEKETVKFVKQ